MTPEDLLRYLQRQPFQPFCVHLSDGVAYDIRHPEMVLVARRTAEIGLPQDSMLPIADKIVTISLSHITRVEPLDAAKTER